VASFDDEEARGRVARRVHRADAEQLEPNEVAPTLHPLIDMQAVNTQNILPEHTTKKGVVRRFSSRFAAADRSVPLIAGSLGFALGSLVSSSLRPKKHRKLFKARLASAKLGSSLGALATGAIALGASATGALAIGALAIGRLKIKQLDVERFRVGSFVEGAASGFRPATV